MDQEYDMPLLRHPFTAMIAGQTGSGKTQLTFSIIRNYKETTTIKDSPLKVVYCYRIWQPIFDKRIPNVEITYFDRLIEESELTEMKPHFIIIDDLMSELSSNPKLTVLFTNISHHKNVSVIFIVQNVFHQGSEMREVSLNSNYIFIMKAVRDKSQISKIGSQFYPGKTKQFVQAYEDATEMPYSYLLMDSTQSCPNALRMRTNIVPDIKGRLDPTFYRLN